MTQKNRRSLRVADLIKRELGWLIERYRKDLNDCLITITNVKLSPDLRLATVYFSVFNNKEGKEKIEHSLKKEASFLRTQLANNIKIKYIPDLRFIYDDSAEYYNHINYLIKKIHEDDSNK
jgi:ribosome-binding factor A